MTGGDHRTNPASVAGATRRARRWVLPSLLLGAAVLGAAVLLQAVRDQGTGGRSTPLADAVPRTLGGWESHDLEIGPSELAARATVRMLRFSDYVHREYRSGGRAFTVYVAYWKSGDAPPWEIAKHTPDNCWPANGWSCEEERHGVALGSGHFGRLPAEWRRFSTPSGKDVHVGFWHLVGGRLMASSSDNLHVQFWRLGGGQSGLREKLQAVASAFRATANQILQRLPEQYFIRITSDQPLEAFAEEPAWGELLEVLDSLGWRDDAESDGGPPAAR